MTKRHSIVPCLMHWCAIILQISFVTAQLSPSINIPTFSEDTSLRVRQDVCDRYSNYDNGEVPLREALRGLELRPLLINSPFLNYNDGKLDSIYPGVDAVILDELADRAGFTWRQSFGIAELIPKGSNRTFSELLMWGTDFYDIFMGKFIQSLSRLQLGISFPQGYDDSSFILVGLAEPPKDSSINLWQWLEPFEPSVWYLIIVTIITSGVLFQILDVPTPKQKQRNKARKPTFNEFRKKNRSDNSVSAKKRISENSTSGAAEAMYEGAHTVGDGIFLSSLLFTQHFQFVPRTPASRLFSASMGLWALLISSNYTANLASFFVIENTPTVAIQSVEDAIQAGYPICIYPGTGQAEYMLRQYPQARYVDVKDAHKDMFRAIREGECPVGVTSRSIFELYKDQRSANPDCNMIWVGRVIKHTIAGMGVKADSGKLCTSLINDVINLHMVEMQADGFLETAIKDHLAKSHDQNCDAILSAQTEEESASRSLKEMAGTFVIHLIFAVAAIVLMIVTRLHDKYKRMSDESRDHFRASIMNVGGVSTRRYMARDDTSSAEQAVDKNRVKFNLAYEEDHSDCYDNQPLEDIMLTSGAGDTKLEDMVEGMEARLKAMVQDSIRQNQREMEQKLDVLVELLKKEKQKSATHLTTWDI